MKLKFKKKKKKKNPLAKINSLACSFAIQIPFEIDSLDVPSAFCFGHIHVGAPEERVGHGSGPVQVHLVRPWPAVLHLTAGEALRGHLQEK